MGAWLLLISRENSTRLPSAAYNTLRGAVCGFWFCSGDSNMSQAQVTEFFCQRKSGAARAPGHRRKGGVRGSSACGFHHGNKESALCCSPVREEFVRVVYEAAGLSNDRQSASSRPDTDPASPRTPKRSSAEAEFDLGAAVFSAAAEHSSVKRRRQAGRAREAEANTTEKTTRGTARKKLVLPEDTTQVRREGREHTGSPFILGVIAEHLNLIKINNVFFFIQINLISPCSQSKFSQFILLSAF